MLLHWPSFYIFEHYLSLCQINLIASQKWCHVHVQAKVQQFGQDLSLINFASIFITVIIASICDGPVLPEPSKNLQHIYLYTKNLDS